MVTPHGPLNTELFLSNATYRRSIGNVNLLTYMIDHGDTHPAQFLVSKRRHHAGFAGWWRASGCRRD